MCNGRRLNFAECQLFRLLLLLFFCWRKEKLIRSYLSWCKKRSERAKNARERERDHFKEITQFCKKIWAKTCQKLTTEYWKLMQRRRSIKCFALSSKIWSTCKILAIENWRVEHNKAVWCSTHERWWIKGENVLSECDIPQNVPQKNDCIILC